MAEEQNVASPFLRAAEIIRQDGWTQGHYECADGSVCLIGALRLAFGYEPEWGPPGEDDAPDHSPYYTAYSQIHTETVCGPEAWNDMPVRTKDEVLTLLERTAKTYA